MKTRIWANIYMIMTSFTTVGQIRCRSWLRYRWSFGVHLVILMESGCFLVDSGCFLSGFSEF